jgi:hypothetical protein
VPKPRIIVLAASQFDPEAAQDIDETHGPGVSRLKAQMNADLRTEDLTKQRASHERCWLIGQPDMEIEHITKGEDKGQETLLPRWSENLLSALTYGNTEGFECCVAVSSEAEDASREGNSSAWRAVTPPRPSSSKMLHARGKRPIVGESHLAILSLTNLHGVQSVC